MPAADLTALARESPWWAGPTSIERDPHLTAAEESPLRWSPPLPFQATGPAVHTLRGPRQVGKTTLLKLWIRSLLHEEGRDPRSVLYLDCERAGLADHRDLLETLRGYLRWIGGGTPVAICLDEVTRVPNWGAAVRGLADEGALRAAVLVATGSHALDLKRGGERMPGRRGRGEDLDHLLLPLSFRDYVAIKAPRAAERLGGFSLSEPLEAVRRSTDQAVVHDAILAAEFERYLATGGFPSAAAREISDGAIGTALYLQHRDAFIGEVIRTGHREAYFRELVRWLFPRLGAEFSWRALAGETEIGAHATARTYVEDLEALFLWHVYHRVKDPERPRPAFKSPKKLYPVDPFTYHTLYAWGRGWPDPWHSTRELLGDPALAGRLVESVVADHLRRVFGRSCFYYRSPGGQEIDFVGWRGDGTSAAIEVKWRGRIERRDWRALSERGGGLLLTREGLSVLSDRPPVLAVPVHIALALLEAPTLRAVGFAD